MRTLLCVLPASLLLGCGDGGGELPPDAEPPPDMELPDTIEVTIHARGAQLLAIREGDEPWRALTPGADGDAVIEVMRGRYAIASVCDDPGFFGHYVILAGPDDPREHDASCGTPAGDLVDVTVASDDDMRVRIGVWPVVAGDTRSVPAGTYDVVAVERGVETPRFVIRRDVAIDADTTLTFDLDTEGTAMRRTAVTATLAEGETATTSTRLSTPRGTSVSVVSDDPASALVFPAAALAAGDKQRVAVSASTEGPATRGGNQVITGDPATVEVTLPPALASASATWNPLAVTWQTDGAWTGTYAYAMDDVLSKLFDVLAHPGWFAAGGTARALTAPPVADLPGWDASWTVASPVGLTWELLLDRDGANGGEQVGWSAPFAVAKTSARHADRDAEEVRAARVLRHQRLGVR